MLAALATGVEAGDDDVARAAVGRGDWLLRGPARRHLERALLDAALVSREMISASDPDAMRHVQRVAALSIVGRYEVDATSRSDVTDAYRTLPATRPIAAPVATILAALAVVFVTAMLAMYVVQLRAHHRVARAPVPLAWGAYLTGGVPASDPALEQFFVTELANLAIETDNDRRGNGADPLRKAHLDELRASPIIASRGPGLAGAWHAMMDALDHWVHVPVKSKGFHEAENALRATTQAVSDQLAALGLAYHLEADVLVDRGAAHAAVFVFRVENVVFVHAGGEPRRVLGLRRLDRLNLAHTLLGMQTMELGDPVVLLDQIDEFVAHRVAPVLGEGRGDGFAYGAPFPLGDASWIETTSGLELSFAATEAIRREIAPIVARGGLDALEHAVVATVRRHEARHGLDNDRDRPLRNPTALEAHVGTGDTPAQRRFTQRANAELSAYTTQIASDPVTPQLALWNLANLGFTKDHWGSAESYVAVVVIEGLARRLGIASHGAVVHDGQIDRSRLAALALPLAAQTDDALRLAARELWEDLYQEPFLAIVD